MTLTFGSNIHSLRAQRLLGLSLERLGRATERLSSGLRINRASDDAASLSVATALNTASRVYGQGIRNVNDGISALSIADSGLETISNVLIRQRELAAQAANGSLSNTQRKSLAQESDQLTQEYNRTLGSLKFNGLNLLTAAFTNMRIQGGFGTDGSIEFGLTDQIRRDIGNKKFTAAANKALAGTTTDIGTADFDGDGDLDIVTTSLSGTTLHVQVHRQDSPNNFGHTSYSLAVANTSSTAIGKLAVGDFNGDGRPDIALAYHENGLSTNVFRVLTNQGNGTAFSSVTYGASVAPPTAMDILAEDLDGDGDTDIAFLGTQLKTYTNNGSGAFGVTNTISATYISIQAADLNNDGKIDLAGLASGATPTIQTYLSSGSTYQTGPSSSLEFLAGSTDFALGDLNRDGYVDLVYNEGSITKLRFGNGSGTFTSLGSTGWSTGVLTGNDSIVIDDMNGDGLLDILVSYSNRAELIFGSIDGSMTQGGPASVSSGGNIVTGDIDGDGVNDLISSGSTTLYVTLHNTDETTDARYVDLRTVADAKVAMEYLDELLEEVQRQRGVIGAALSRLESFLSNLHDLKIGSESARSRILDSDIALESAEVVRQQILQDVGSSILGQANQAPKIALTLLQAAGGREQATRDNGSRI